MFRAGLLQAGVFWTCLLAVAGAAQARPPVAPSERTPPKAAPQPQPKAPLPKAVSKPFDPAHTRFSFELRTRWGQRVEGVFSSYDGEVTTLPDGRHQVRIELSTASVTVGRSERYTALARGERFFDSERYPRIEFVSEPHSADLVQTGGKLRGRLSLHGISRMETFVIEPAACAQPGLECDVVAEGAVSRYDYGLDAWQLALGERVRFTLQVRLKDAKP